jgi:hypothetical protein
LLAGLALSLFASTHPADPAPTTIKSASNASFSIIVRKLYADCEYYTTLF